MNKKGTKKLSGALAATTVLTSVAGATPAFAKGTDWDAIYKTAYEAMVKAEKDRNQESIIVAREAIGKLLANKDLIHAAETFSVHVDTVQQELFNKFYKIIYVKEGVEKENISQKEINEAREYVDQFGKCKENVTYVSSWSTKIDEFQGKNIKAAQDAVEKAKKSGSDKDIQAAQNLVVELATSTNEDTKKEAARLQKELDVLNTKVSVELVNAVSETELQVTLSREVDEIHAENFKIDGMKVVSATLGKDKKTVDLKVENAKLETKYTLKVSGVKANKLELKETSKDFTMPSVDAFYSADVQIDKAEIKADGQSIAKVTFTLKDKKGNVVKDAKKVQVDFSTTLGRLSENKVTVQNGTATAILTSEVLNQAKIATVTATIKEAENKNFIGLKGSKNIIVNPNPNAGVEENVGATLTEVQAAQADRVIAYFNKDVSVEKYCKKGTHEIDTKKAQIIVNSDGTAKNVVGVLPVEGNSKALQILLKDGDELKDNADFTVTFKDLTGSKAIEQTQKSKLTDSRIPAMLNAEVPYYNNSKNKDLKTLKVTFSEPVQLGETGNGAANKENWIIDGINLNKEAKWGKDVKVEVGTFNSETGQDNRNVVTITLGKDSKEKQLYFQGGKHSVQASKIGDRANVSDKDNNIMTTQSMDFDVEIDKSAPNATVEVQSPRQYIVRFDKEINDTNKDLSGILQLKGAKSPKFTVTQNPNNATEYKVYIDELWTNTYKTATTNKNYYNDAYKLVIGEGTAVGASNGVANAKDIELKLNGPMTSPDTKSPEIKSVKQVKNNVEDYISVELSEPIIQEGSPVVDLIKKDNSKTITNVPVTAKDFYNKELIVNTPADLDGGEWNIVVKDATDHVGNKAASLTGTLKVDQEAEAKFSVLWIKADEATNKIYVKFNKAIKTNGKSENALNVTNYQLDGKALPQGSTIEADIAGVDDKDGVFDSITIKLPQNTLKKDASHVLVVPEYLEANGSNEKLSNSGSKTLPWSINEGKQGYDKGQVEEQYKVEKAIYDAEQELQSQIKENKVDKLGNIKTNLEQIKTDKKLAEKDTEVISSKKLLARINAVLNSIAKLEAQEKALKDIAKANAVEDFAKAGITGVNANNLDAAKNVINKLAKKDDRKEVQSAIDTLNKSVEIINNKDLEDIVTPAVFEKAGITGVTNANLKDVLAAIRAEQATAAKAMKAPSRNRLVLNAPQKLRTLTAKEIQKVVNDVAAEIKNKEDAAKNLADAKTKLTTAIEGAQKLNQADYTPESWADADLTKVIATANTIKDKKDATLDEVNTQIKALTEAEGKLNKKAQ